LTTIGAILIDWLILDVLACLLLKATPSLAALFKWKGYLFDELAYEAWKKQKKVE